MKRTIFRKVMVMTFLLLSAVCGRAQDNVYDRTTISSPTPASLGKYVDFPVNTHTGIPEISIPIYTIETGNFKLPITLGNHPSGLKVLEPSSAAGLGFALNAGGVITRTVRGAPDERSTSTIYNQDHGWYSDTGYMRRFYSNLMQDWQGVAAGRRDGEPDLYTFNFAGYIGKFFFSDDRKPVILADGKNRDIEIRCTYLGGNSIGTFVLITPDGNRYNFGGTLLSPDNAEVTSPFTVATGFQEGKVISTWYLTQIVSTDLAQTITFTYASENYSFHSITSAPISSLDNTNSYDANLIKNFVKGKRLTRIDWKTGSVLINYGAARTDLGGYNTKELGDSEVNSEARPISSIDITNNQGFCKRFNFYTSYFQDNTTALPAQLGNLTINTDRKRLRLDSIKEISCTGLLPQPAIKFEYFTEFVPRRLTFAQDYWGFYNGQTGNTKLTPTITETGTTTVIPGANRAPSWPQMRAGTLKRIYWPTGGNTEYQFEPHFVTTSIGTPQYVNRKNLTIGYDGSNPEVKTDTVTLVGGSYKITLLNTTGGSDAHFSLKNNSTGDYYISISTNTDTKLTDSIIRTLPDGVYTITIIKNTFENGSTSGNGATGIIDRYTGSSGPTDVIVGGLRIKNILAYDHLSGTTNATQYDYIQNGRSSGILYSRPVYAALIRNDLVAQLGDWSPSGFQQACNPQGCIACVGFPYFRSANSIQPMSTSQGEHIGYEEVSVGKPDNGYSVYRYYTGMPIGYVTPSLAVTSVDRSTCSYSVPNFPYAPDEYNNLRGKLKEEMHFRSDGKILKDVLYTHHYDTPTDSTRCFMAAALSGTYLGTFYWLTSSRKYKEVIYTTMYAEDGPDFLTNTQTVYYGSKYHNAPTKEVYFDSKGDSIVTTNKYVKDYEPNCGYVFTCSSNYRNACNSCQATYTAAQNACAGQGGACYTNAFLAYQKCMDNARITYSDCRLQKELGFTDYYWCRRGYRSTADSNLAAIYSMALDNNNERVEQSTFKAGLLVDAKINLHKRMNDSFRVSPNQLQTLPIAAPGNSFSQSGISGNNLSKDARYVREASVLFDSGVVHQLSSDYNPPISTIWDYRFSYRTAVATNATIDQIAYTSFEADNRGGWIYEDNSIADTNAMTGKIVHRPLTGIYKSGLDVNRTYILSYWTEKTTPFTIAGTIAYIHGTANVNGWRYFEHKISGVTVINLTGNFKIDELKLYPEGSQMVTYTYEPLVGMTSVSSASDQIIRYNYDALGRLIAVSDRERKLMKVYDYQFQVPTLQ